MTRHRAALLSLLEAWARWRLGGNSYPSESSLYRAGLAMPRSPNRPGSRPPGRVKAATMETVQAAYLGTGTMTGRAEALGLSW